MWRRFDDLGTTRYHFQPLGDAMSTYPFTSAQRWAVFKVHGGRRPTCWLCGNPLVFTDMEVDHVLPECLLEQKHVAARAAAFSDFALPEDFNINGCENWLPAHAKCNAIKRDTVFRATPLIQLYVDRVRSMAMKVSKAIDNEVSDRKAERAIGDLLNASDEVKAVAIKVLQADYASANSSPVPVTIVKTPSRPGTIGFATTETVTRYEPPDEVRLTPTVTVVFEGTPQPTPEGPFSYKVILPDVE